MSRLDEVAHGVPARVVLVRDLLRHVGRLASRPVLERPDFLSLPACPDGNLSQRPDRLAQLTSHLAAGNRVGAAAKDALIGYHNHAGIALTDEPSLRLPHPSVNDLP